MNFDGIDSRVASRSFDAQHPMFRYQVEAVPSEVSRKMKDYDHFVVVGLGGSVLPLKVFVKALGLENRVLFLDSLSDSLVECLLALPRTMFCVVSKSGETVEIQALFQEILRAGRSQDVMIVTDPQKGRLRSLVSELGVASLPIPQELGGRFTHFTVLHRALLERFGFSFEDALKAARLECDQLKKDPMILEQLFLSMMRPGKSKLILWAYGERWIGFADWLQQAVAESLGKFDSSGNSVGVFPIVLRGPQDQHSVLQLLMDGPQDFCLWFFDETPQVARLVAEGDRGYFPSLARLSLSELRSLFCDSIYASFQERLQNPKTATALMRIQSDLTLEDVGTLIARFQSLIEYAGAALKINAFDQPGVERGKQILKQRLAKN